MTAKALLPCLVCGVELDNTFPDALNQPSEGTRFETFGHYGSTFWDSFNGEELLLNVCDECLRAHPERLARHKRYRRLTCYGMDVGREWLDREPVPYFEGEEDRDALEIEPTEIGNLPGVKVEWPDPGYLETVRATIAKMAEAEQ